MSDWRFTNAQVNGVRMICVSSKIEKYMSVDSVVQFRGSDQSVLCRNECEKDKGCANRLIRTSRRRVDGSLSVFVASHEAR